MDLEDILMVLLEDCEVDDILIEEYDDFFIIEAQQIRTRTRVRFNLFKKFFSYVLRTKKLLTSLS